MILGLPTVAADIGRAPAGFDWDVPKSLTAMTL